MAVDETCDTSELAVILLQGIAVVDTLQRRCNQASKVPMLQAVASLKLQFN